MAENVRFYFTDFQNHDSLDFRLMKTAGPLMTDSPPPAQTRETVRARRLARRMGRIEWRQSCFDLVSAGHSYAEVANRLMVSERTVRRTSPASSPSAASMRRSAISICRSTG